MSFRRFALFFALVLAACLPLQVSAQAVATPSRITAAVDNAQRVALAGSVSPRLARATDLGTLAGSTKLDRMVLVLKRTDAQEQDLQALIAAQHQAGSDQFHKWLTPEQFATRFGPSSSDLTKVTTWLQGQGFTGLSTSRAGQRIEFSGTASSVQTAFGTSLHQFSVPTKAGAETHIANASAISVPAALAPVIHSVLSLNDFRSKPLSVPAGTLRRDSKGELKRETTATDGNGNYQYYVSPGDLRKIYGASGLPATATGAGVSIAIIGRTDVSLSDIQAFRSIFSLPANDPNIVLSGPDPGIADPGDQGESSLDLEWAGAVAPSATLNFVIAGSTDTTDGIFLASSYAVDNVVSPIISVSYGECEQEFGPSGNAAISQLWEQAAAEGISVFIATGDAGAASCDAGNGGPATYGDTVNGLASTPYNTAVGGTQFAEGAAPNLYWQSSNASDLSSAVGYIPEHVWNSSCDPSLPSGEDNCNYSQTYYNIEGGGGGRSNCALGTVDSADNVTCTGGWPKPSWQKGTGVPADNVRDLPDVSFNSSAADDPYIICYAGACEYTIGASGQVSITTVSLAGGTSVATPIMAGIMALVEQQNGQYLGLANYNLYALANQAGTSCTSSSRTDPTQSATCIFNDVTVGNNGAPGLPNFGTSTADFTATPGYDLATGWGSMNIANLVNNWSKGNASSTTTTTLTAGSGTVQHGAPIAVQVKVASTTGTPTGDVALMTSQYGSADHETLVSGAWSGSVSDLPGGTYNLSAHYAGDGTFSSSTSATTAVTITPESSVSSLVVSTYNGIALIPDTTSNYYGTPLYFKGTVVGASGKGIATGTVNLLVDGVVNQSAVLTTDGGYLLESESIGVGTHTITTSYAGDNSFNASVSAKSTITVGVGQSVTYPTIVSAPSIGSPYTLAATVTGSGPALPTGTVQFYDNNLPVCAAQTIVYNGPQGAGYAQAACTYTITAAGQHVLTSTYSGDSTYQPVTLTGGFNYTRTITLAANAGTTATTTKLSMTSGATVAIGQTARFVIAVAPTSSAVTTLPTGSAYLIDGNGATAYVNPLSGGYLNADIYVYAAGTYTYKASYGGNSTFAASTSANTVTFTVPFATPTTTFTASTNYAAPNTQTTLNFRTYPLVANAFQTVAGTGTVTYTDSVNGGAATSLGTFTLVEANGQIGGYSGRFVLPAGVNVITAAYSGNASFNPASNTVTVTVGSPDFTVTSTPASLAITAGTSGMASLSLAPTLSYTGTATLACGSGVPAGATCKITPATVTFGAAQTATVTISTLAPSPSTSGMLFGMSTREEVAALSLAGLLVFLLPVSRRHRRMLSMGLPAVLLFTVLGFSGCSGSGNSNTSNGPSATLLSLKSSGIKVASGTSVTLTASLNGLSGTPTGTVQFYDAGVAVGSPATVTSGVATLQTSTLSVGGHVITATYSGDSNNNSSTAGAITQVVTGTTNVQITATSGTLVHTVSLPVTLN